MTGLIVHEWLAHTGGSENVVDAMLDAFPDADLWVLWNDNVERFPHARESWLAKTPGRLSRVASLPLMPAAWRRIDTGRTYDWILASSHLFAHHARLRGQTDTPKLAYVHTPARYIWAPEIDERGRTVPARAAAPALRALDRARSSELRSVAANSCYIRERIRRAWGLDARVIYPPVEVSRILAVEDWADSLDDAERATLETLPSEFLLGASRLVRYKQMDAVIRLGEMLRIPVVIAGSGPEEGRLRTLAEASSVPVRFVGAPSNQMLYALYQRALVYIFLAIEDFGIMPAEAMACGTPVLVGSVGGASESVTACQGGLVLKDPFDRGELTAALEEVRSIDRAALRKRSMSFSRERFIADVRSWLEEVVGTDA